MTIGTIQIELGDYLGFYKFGIDYRDGTEEAFAWVELISLSHESQVPDPSFHLDQMEERALVLAQQILGLPN